MAIGEGRTVWILGAGFSKALGGPLLVDLFRQEAFDDLFELMGDQRAAQLTWTQALFNQGKDRLWENAEDFLAYIAAAATRVNPHPRKRALLKGVINSTAVLSNVSRTEGFNGAHVFDLCQSNPLRTVLRAFAMETGEFLRDNPIDQEQWRPYVAWSKSLDPDRDTIITFNYDTVLERLGDERLQVVLPAQKAPLAKVPILKLHGSTDWYQGNTGEVRVDPNAVDHDVDVVIAAPGRSKASLTSTLLKPLWDEAKYRLKHAAVIVIVGYGFPKTDAQARLDLLAAMAEDNAGMELRQMHLVLGPEVSLPSHRRVLELVRYRLGSSRTTFINEIPSRYLSQGARRTALIVQHPLWAEDFIGEYFSRTNMPPVGG